MLRLTLILTLGLLKISHVHIQGQETSTDTSESPTSAATDEYPFDKSSVGETVSFTSGISPTTLLPQSTESIGTDQTLPLTTTTATTTTTTTTLEITTEAGNGTSTFDDKDDLPLILGLSLGIGIPVLIGLIAGLVYYFKVYKPRQQRVTPNQDPTISNKTTAAVTNVPLAPMRNAAENRTTSNAVV